jgi:hypothetical protein
MVEVRSSNLEESFAKSSSIAASLSSFAKGIAKGIIDRFNLLLGEGRSSSAVVAVVVVRVI